METLNQLLLEYPRLMYGGAGATAFVAGGTLVYKIATRKKPTHVNVNCWFCNQDTVVPYGNRNCWDCPDCDQYNGFQENGDYNKPIPAQHSEHLNHGVSAGVPVSESPSPKTQQFVDCRILLCKKCNINQSVKIKQLASFIPREDENYDEEIEVYKHHLEQTYKLCKPCQLAVEHYIKFQNRQLRAVLFNHQTRRSRDSDKAFVKNYSFATPIGVILLRALAFLACAFLVAALVFGSRASTTASEDPQTLSGGVVPPKPAPLNESMANGSSETAQAWQELLNMIPKEAVENAHLVWQYGKSHQMAVVSAGLVTCITSIFVAGPDRLRRVDACASVLWFMVLCLYVAEVHLQAHVSGWLDTAKLAATSLCCLVCFAAMTTRKFAGPRRARGRRYLSGSSLDPVYAGPSLFPCPGTAGCFAPMPPPYLTQLISRQQSPRERRASPSSLPGRLNRALSLGTIPSLAKTESGYLFSGSRPPSQCKDSPPSDYFSLKSGSRPSSPGPSPTPSLAGSVTSSSSSARQRRPLISPARLNIGGQRLRLFSHHTPEPMSPPAPSLRLYSEPTPTPTPTPSLRLYTEPMPAPSSHFHLDSMPAPSPHYYPDAAPSVQSGRFSPDTSPFHSQNGLSSPLRDGSVIEEEEEERRRSSFSGSSACMVDTTTGGLMDSSSGTKGFLGRVLWPGLLVISLSVNLFFSSLYLYRNWR